MDMKFDQVVRVESDETGSDFLGGDWRLNYVLYRTRDDDGRECFDLYDDDGSGNGTMICRGYHQNRMVSLTLRLGEFVEWRAPYAAEA